MSRLRLLSVALAAVLAVAAAACTNDEPPQQPTSSLREVRIGVLAPRTGASSAAGTDVQRGAELAAALVNGDEGQLPLAGLGAGGLVGLGGAKLTVVVADTKGDPQTGAAEAARLVAEERVAGLVGAYDPAVTELASQRTERLGVPFVNGDSPAGYLTERGLDWFFRVGPTDRMFGESLFSALRQASSGGASKVSVLYTDDRPGNVLADLVADLADEGGFQLVSQVGVDPKGSATAAVGRLRDGTQQPDAVFVVASTPGEAAKLIKAFGQARYNPAALVSFGAGLPAATLAAAGPDGQGVLASTAWSREIAGRNPAAKPVMELYEQRFGQPMSEVAAGAFTAVQVLAEAIDNAGSIDPQRVRSALLNLEIPGRELIMPWTGVRFDASRQNEAATGVVEQRVEELFRVVFPEELRQASLVWPRPAPRP